MDYDEISGPSGGRARGARPSGARGTTPASRSPATEPRSSGSAGTAAPRAASPLTTLSPAGATWLVSRAIDPAVIEACEIVSAAVASGGEWVAFPYRCRGQVVNHKYRCVTDKRFMQDKGGKQVWWNADCIIDEALASQPLIITEGEVDAMSAMTAGYQRVVSVPGGAPMAPTEGDGKYGFLADSLNDLRGVEIILAVDNDGPGIALLQDLTTRLGKGRCRYVVYPDGCKDLNDVLVGYGPEAVVRCINGARWVKVTGLCRMSELPPVPDVMGLDPTIPGLGEHFRPRKGDFAVLTGVPGTGKSTLVNDFACGMAWAHGWRTVFASFEQNPQVDHRRALRTWHAGRPEGQLTAQEIVRADLWIDEFFSFVIPDEDEESDLDWLLERLAAAVVRYGAEMAVIDPWNELDHARPRDMSLTEYVGTAIRKLKRFARKMNVFLVVVAHPTKLQRDKEGKTPMPTLYDISDSSHWANKADLGVVLHYGETPSGAPCAVVKVAKSRYHDRIGRPGEVKLWFNRDTARYEQAI